MSQFLHDDDNDDAKAIAIPPVFSENSQAKNFLKAVSIFKYSDMVNNFRQKGYVYLSCTKPLYINMTKNI